MTKLNKVFSIILLIIIAVALGYLGYALSTPKQSDKFTEFYLLGLDGKAEGYPKEATAGEPVYLTIGIVNHEYQTTSYRVEIRIRGETISNLLIDSLNNDQKWEQVIHFTPQLAIEKQKVEFYLYKNNEPEPYFKEPLCLHIDIR